MAKPLEISDIYDIISNLYENAVYKLAEEISWSRRMLTDCEGYQHCADLALTLNLLCDHIGVPEVSVAESVAEAVEYLKKREEKALGTAKAGA